MRIKRELGNWRDSCRAFTLSGIGVLSQTHHYALLDYQTSDIKYRKRNNPCQGKHRKFGNFAKTQGIWCAQVSIFPDSKGTRYFAICRKNSQISFEDGYMYQDGLVYLVSQIT